MPDDNKSTSETDKPVEDTQPNLPEEPTQPEAATVDEYAKYREDIKDLDTAYKKINDLEGRYEESSAEGKRRAEAAEKAQKELDDSKAYVETLSTELQTVFQNDPGLRDNFQKALQTMQTGPSAPTEQAAPVAQLSDEDRKLLDNVRAREAANANAAISDFREANKDIINTDEEWDNIASIAASLDGKKDREGKPYNISTALNAALAVNHPEVIADKARMETLANVERRDSATEAGDVPRGSASDSGDSKELSEQEKTIARRGGISEEAYAEAKARRS